jgi:hypothetical protein
MPPNTVYVGRPTKWGNPYRLGLDGARDEVLAKFREYANFKRASAPSWLNPLVSKDLTCWCPLSKPCHADILMELVQTTP